MKKLIPLVAITLSLIAQQPATADTEATTYNFQHVLGKSLARFKALCKSDGGRHDYQKENNVHQCRMPSGEIMTQAVFENGKAIAWSIVADSSLETAILSALREEFGREDRRTRKDGCDRYLWVPINHPTMHQLDLCDGYVFWGAAPR